MNRAPLVFPVVIVALLVLGDRIAAQTPANACGLVAASDLQPLLGGTVNLKPSSIGEIQTCSGEGPTGRVMVRLFKRTGDPGGAKEQAGIDALKKMGAQVDVKSSGGVTCVSTIPPEKMAQMGYGTSCTVMSKAPMYAVIEVASKAQKDMVTMDKLRPIAEKMAARF